LHNISYVLFDFDGTIVDSMGFLENNAVDLLTTHYDFSASEARRLYRETTGLPFVQQIEIISPNTPDLNKKVTDLFEKMKIDRIFEQKLFPESFQILKELKTRGYRIGISSGTFEHIVTDYFSKYEITFVDDVLGYRDRNFEKGRPHFNHIISKYNLNSKNIVFIGDSLNDAKRAKENNIFFIAKMGLFKEEDFEKIIPGVKTIPTLNELLPLFPPLVLVNEPE